MGWEARLSDYILVIDEGTTSTRAIAFDRDLRPAFSAQEEVALQYPADGWVEQDPEEIWSRTLSVCRSVIDQAGGASAIAGIGIANQRETTLVWDRESGTCFGPAIIWQDRRTADRCRALIETGSEPLIQSRTGLLIDPYFSASKIEWILANNEAAHDAAEDDRAAFGTVESFLIWRLTGGRTHVSDVTNASRTSLLGLHALAWDDDLADLFSVPDTLLPAVCDSGAHIGDTDAGLFGAAIPILSAIGDQQAALVGQGCLSEGEAKITYGTGAFLVANTGETVPRSSNRLLATSGYRTKDVTAYALEGSIFNAGTVVKWLRDELALISDAADTEAMAASLSDNGGVYFVPAFTGLGAPHWDPEARGQITGLSRGTRAPHIVRAGLEASAYQTLELLEAFAADGADVSVLRVDGGMAVNDWLMQFLADICDRPVERPPFPEMTAFGAAVLAANELGWTTLADWQAGRQIERRFEPAMDASVRERLVDGWADAVHRSASRSAS